MNHRGEYSTKIEFAPVHITFNKIHSTIALHIKEKKAQETLITLIQEIKREIYFRNPNTPHPSPEPVQQDIIIAHLITATINLSNSHNTRIYLVTLSVSTSSEKFRWT